MVQFVLIQILSLDQRRTILPSNKIRNFLQHMHFSSILLSKSKQIAPISVPPSVRLGHSEARLPLYLGPQSLKENGTEWHFSEGQ